MQRNIFVDPSLFIFHSGQTQHLVFAIDTADMFSINFLQHDANDNFVNAHNDLALLEFGPYSILKHTHVVLKLRRLFGFKDRRNILSKTTARVFWLGCNSITFFKTCPTHCTAHVYLPWVFCEIAFGCANYCILILWMIGTDVTEKDTKNMAWYNCKNLGYHNVFHILFYIFQYSTIYHTLLYMASTTALKFRSHI